MAAGDTAQGRRREDVQLGYLPEDPQLGDYWKYVQPDGEPLHSSEPSNLTGTVWGIRPPLSGFSIATLTKHTVREHDDGTISVRPDDGSSNSIKVISPHHGEWHGYVERGVWREV